MRKNLFVVILVIFVLCAVSCVGALIPAVDSTPTPNTSLEDDPSFDIDFSRLTYCAYGDSITYGANYLDSYKQMENPYPTLVANTLGLKSYRNAGVSGATLISNANDGRVCVAEIVKDNKQSYDIISLMAGVNDFSISAPLGVFGDVDTSSVYGSLDFIAKTLKSNNPSAFIFFMTPYKKGNGTTKNSNGYTLLDVAKAVKTVAEKYYISVLDMYEDGKYEVYGMYGENSDQLHPNQDFVTMYTAPQIVRFIRANYGK